MVATGRETPPLIVRLISFEPAPRRGRRRGLLGYAVVTLNELLVLDAVRVHQTEDGHMRLSFPIRDDRYGRRHGVLRPLNDAVRRDIEHQVFRQLARRLEGGRS
jgi:DNA-binding cell septation regulator SpoVG